MIFVGSPLLETLDELRKCDPQSKTHGAELHQIQASLAGFHLAHERLALLEPLGEVDLRQIGRFAGFPQQGREKTVFASVDRLVHSAACE